MTTTQATKNAFNRVLRDQKTVLYFDACFAKAFKQYADDPISQPGLDFLSTFREEIIANNKRIVIMRYVMEELEKHANKNQEWAVRALSFIENNKDLFKILRKTKIESELDNLKESRGFADEAIRRRFIELTSCGLIPILLSADYGCARTASVISQHVCVFTIDHHNLSEAGVREWNEFLADQKSVYLRDTFPNMLKGCDIVLTSSALRSDYFPYFLENLEEFGTENERQPIYIHKQSYMHPCVKAPNITAVKDKINFVDKTEYQDEENCIIAEYTSRNSGRLVMLVGLQNELIKLKERIDSCPPLHLNNTRRDNILYYIISPLGKLVPAKKIPGSANWRQIKEAVWQAHVNSTSTDTDTNKRVSALLESAYAGNTNAMGLVAQMFKLGVFLPQSEEKYWEWHNLQALTSKENAANSGRCIGLAFGNV